MGETLKAGGVSAGRAGAGDSARLRLDLLCLDPKKGEKKKRVRKRRKKERVSKKRGEEKK